MTYEEAIGNLKYLISGDCTANQMDFVEEIEMAINALEKQIPKKPTGDLHSVPHYRCTTCKIAVVMYEDSTRFPYCHHCGQALDWR